MGSHLTVDPPRKKFKPITCIGCPLVFVPGNGRVKRCAECRLEYLAERSRQDRGPLNSEQREAFNERRRQAWAVKHPKRPIKCIASGCEVVFVPRNSHQKRCAKCQREFTAESERQRRAALTSEKREDLNERGRRRQRQAWAAMTRKQHEKCLERKRLEKAKRKSVIRAWALKMIQHLIEQKEIENEQQTQCG